MKDFLGKELKVGDTVVFAHANYTKICVGHIVKFGKTQVILDQYYGYGSKFVTDNKDAPSWRRRVQRYPYDVVKLEGTND